MNPTEPDMPKTLIAAILSMFATPGLACPALEIGKTFEIDQSVSFRLEGPAGYEMQVGEVPNTLLTVNLRPEGTTSMDIATGKVSAPTIRMGLALRPISPENMEMHLQTAEGKPFIELPNVGKAYREDITQRDIRHYLYPEIDGEPRQLEVVVMVPPQIEACVSEYEDAARAMLESLAF